MKNAFTIDELINFNTFWITVVDTDINNWSTTVFPPWMFEIYSDRFLFLGYDDHNNIAKNYNYLEIIKDDIENWIKIYKPEFRNCYNNL